MKKNLQIHFKLAGREENQVKISFKSAKEEGKPTYRYISNQLDKKEKTAGSSMEAGQTKLCLFLGAFKLQK